MSEQRKNGEILTEEQLALLETIQNRLIPAENEMPGAGDAGCATILDRFLSENPAFRNPVITALSAVETSAVSEASHTTESNIVAPTHVTFRTLSDQAQDAALRRFEKEQPELFQILLRQTFTAYYTDPVVLLILGWNPPQPDGYPTPPPFDEALLTNVKRRGKVWRDA